MTSDPYHRLAQALHRLPNAFPRTQSNVEIRLLKKIFSSVEADLASHLQGEMESVDLIADRVGLSPDAVGKKLVNMAKNGLVWSGSQGGRPHFRLAPFMVGIYESQLDTMDREFAELFERYMAEGGAAGIMKPKPALHRVVPAQESVRADWILPYDDVRGMILSARQFRVRGCVCRVQQDLLGKRKCDFPVENCLMLSHMERPVDPDDLTREQALAVLDETEKLGLVHTTSNVVHGISYICNCCGCCCGILRGITDWGVANSVARANYYAVVEPKRCTGCRSCVDRCQVGAISLDDDIASVNHDLCIGCGLCVTGCPGKAVRLERKREADVVHPPKDFDVWEHQRLRNRGISG
jgi:electron transport complex protein RnfB